jgi:hypothetical protein
MNSYILISLGCIHYNEYNILNVLKFEKDSDKEIYLNNKNRNQKGNPFYQTNYDLLRTNIIYIGENPISQLKELLKDESDKKVYISCFTEKDNPHFNKIIKNFDKEIERFEIDNIYVFPSEILAKRYLMFINQMNKSNHYFFIESKLELVNIQKIE